MTRFCGFPPTEKASGDFEEMSLLAANRSVKRTSRSESRNRYHDDVGRRGDNPEAARQRWWRVAEIGSLAAATNYPSR